MRRSQYSTIIIGGGIVGVAIAYELSTHGHKNICVIERNESIVGRNQSTRNGGVIHSGLYYPKDIEPLKATLCVEGNILMYEFCKTYNISHKKTGKLVLATNSDEEEFLDFFSQIGTENGIIVNKITSQQAKKMEPNIGKVTMALHVPSTGSAALAPLLEKLKELAEVNGVKFLFNTKVTAIAAKKNSFTISALTDSTIQTIKSETLINAAGLYSDEIAKMVNPSLKYEIAPARGELYKFNLATRKNISFNDMHLYVAPFFYYNETKEIAQLPIKELRKLLKLGKVTKTLGAHVSPTMGNIATVGPLKSLHSGKEDYTTDLKKPEDYIQKIHPIFPNLKVKDIEPHFTGIMAVRKGFTDFTIKRDEKFPNCIQLVGMDSPAWTANLAIAKYLREKVL